MPNAASTSPASDPRGQAVPDHPRRGKELVLLIAASVIVGFALLLVQLAQEQELSPALLWITLAFLGLSGGAHLLIRWLAPYADPVLLPGVALLNGLGLVMIRRIDMARGKGVMEGAAVRQLMWSAIAVAAAIGLLCLIRDHRRLRRYTFTFALAGLALLMMPLRRPGPGRGAPLRRAPRAARHGPGARHRAGHAPG